MKKGLLLSIVASTFIFAGGDIVPMEPVVETPAPAPVAKCGNFTGSIGAYYESRDPFVGVGYDMLKGSYLSRDGEADIAGYKAELKRLDDMGAELFDKEVSKFDITAAIAMEKEFGYGVTVGVEVAGWRDSHEIADHHRVGSVKTNKYPSDEYEHSGGELSQLWVAKSFGNTAIKLGRQALPSSLMPFAWTDTTAGVKDTTYEGIVFANTSMKDTTIYGGWIGAGTNGGERTVLDDHTRKSNGELDMESGLFALGFRTSSLWNLGMSGFYAGDHRSVWGDVAYKVAGWDSGLQVVWASDDGVEGDDTMAVAGKFGKDFGKWDAKVVLSYITAGNSQLNLLGGTNAAFWGDLGENTHVYADDSKGIGGVVDFKNIWNGKIYLGAGYTEIDSRDNAAITTGTVGYKTTVAGFGVKAEYKYYTFSSDIDEFDGDDGARVRLEAVYKF